MKKKGKEESAVSIMGDGVRKVLSRQFSKSQVKLGLAKYRGKWHT